MALKLTILKHYTLHKYMKAGYPSGTPPKECSRAILNVELNNWLNINKIEHKISSEFNYALDQERVAIEFTNPASEMLFKLTWM
jgi:hypothetical protein